MSINENRKERLSGSAEDLHRASRTGDLVKIRQLVESGVGVDISGAFGQTPLIVAALFGQGKAVSLLLELGADCNRVADKGVTALIEAARVGTVDSVEALRHAGANTSIKYMDRTALEWARHFKHNQIESLLNDLHDKPT